MFLCIKNAHKKWEFAWTKCWRKKMGYFYYFLFFFQSLPQQSEEATVNMRG
jgi:hypothetical protein